jgi:selenocysteine lyase/cysteine desulfurase
MAHISPDDFEPTFTESDSRQFAAPESGKTSRVYGWNLFIPTTVEDLLQIPEEKYIPPPLPIQLPTFPDAKTEKFGLEFRKAHFFLRDVTYLNHGAFGGAVREVLNFTQRMQEHCEKQPVRFFDRELMQLLAHVTRQMAKFVGTDPWDLLLLPNATMGVNVVLRSVSRTFDSDDSICFFNTTYPMTTTLLRYLKTDFNINSYQIDLKFPIQSKEEIVETIKSNLRPKTKLLIVDHISSGYAFITPLKEVVEVCHSRGIMVLVDGAHALGSIPLNLKEFGADFYTANGHKWFCSPKGCAVMYVAPQHQKMIRPLVVSHGLENGFASEFIFSGTKDYASWIGLLALLEFWNHYGPERIRDYIHTTVMTGAEILTKQWKTGLLAEKSLFGPMFAVKLPKLAMFADKDLIDSSNCVVLQNILFHEHNIEVPVKVHEGQLYVRISAHVYNDLSEFQHFADVVSKMAA